MWGGAVVVRDLRGGWMWVGCDVLVVVARNNGQGSREEVCPRRLVLVVFDGMFASFGAVVLVVGMFSLDG